MICSCETNKRIVPRISRCAENSRSVPLRDMTLPRQMNFQQLRSVREAVRCGFNLTEVAHTLHTSQPGVSRQIRDLENELGILLFKRSGKRLTGLTSPGDHLLPIIERVLDDSLNLRQAGHDFLAREEGLLSIAATHSQARYALPAAVQEFRRLSRRAAALHQGAPEHIAEWVLSGKAAIGIATEGLSAFPDLVSFPCYRWSHLVVAPEGHPIFATSTPLRLEDLAEHPLITYDVGFTGRSHIDAAFVEAGLALVVAVLRLPAREGPGRVRVLENCREVKPGRPGPGRQVRSRPEKVDPSDNLVQPPVAHGGKNLADFLGNKGEEVDYMFRPALEPGPDQVLPLGGDSRRARVQVALPGHIAADGHQRRRAEPVFVGPKEGGNNHVPAGLEAAVSPQAHPTPQAVEHQHLLGLGQAQLPGAPGILD